MLRLIAYDVKDPRRLRKIARICQDYGIRVEYSVFECDLNENMFHSFLERILKVIDPRQDRFIAYRICSACERNAVRVGTLARRENVTVYII